MILYEGVKLTISKAFFIVYQKLKTLAICFTDIENIKVVFLFLLISASQNISI